MTNEKNILDAYKSLWHGRSGVKNIDSLAKVKLEILSELRDEMSHPRARRSPTVKLKLAFERIDSSNLALEEKESIKAFYTNQHQLLIDSRQPRIG